MLTRSLSKLMLHSPTTTRVVFMDTVASSDANFQPNQLALIPDEVLSHILSFLSLADIGMICLTGSSWLRDRMVAWIITMSCSRKVSMHLTRDSMDHQPGYEEWVASCKQFGMLCKRASMLYSTSTRLRLLTSWFSKLECRVCSKMNQDWSRLMGRVGLAAALSTFTLGWDETEFGRVVGWWRDGCELEEDKRRELRIFFWEFIDSEDTKSSWLSYIINTFTTKTSYKKTAEHHAAHLLFHLLGPPEDDLSVLPPAYRDFNFFQMCLHIKLQGKRDMMNIQEQVPNTFSEAREMFSDMGKGLRLLLRSATVTNSFLSSMMVSMFENMHWMVDNQAACLLFSCESVVKLFLADMTRRKGGIVKLSHMLVAMMVVCDRLSNDLNQGLSKILKWSFTLLEKHDRKMMIAEFWKEVGERLEEGDMGEGILVQLGVLVSGKAYWLSGGSNCKQEGLVEGESSEE